ncbi:MAG: Asp-tRNA(Asn)/Glu-tRNA(Gln) amidotransferase subunit GatC [Leptospira sp.]|jgi:aspartyl-tRNA(Asn)/glutamyl-tRNA(Gln) amidotransferase subunit C|nr:Asp-tRNA(Asn)/Glu-tRNA(Gln) amidotransferase subunit GatC [Leptospira sp.]NCS93525.1 Asp-tRNA(Asn)/Glu-tRNA(Gln) amidotransferase subunit GatC [Leptospira sp.]
MDIGTLRNIASLAKLKVDDNEADKFVSDFNKMIEYVDVIKSLNTDSIQEDEIYFNHQNFTRPDTVDNNLNRDLLSKIAPEYENGFIVVPKVIET